MDDGIYTVEHARRSGEVGGYPSQPSLAARTCLACLVRLPLAKICLNDVVHTLRLCLLGTLFLGLRDVRNIPNVPNVPSNVPTMFTGMWPRSLNIGSGKLSSCMLS